MRILVAGATGAIGRPLVRRLLDAGHDVVGLTRSRERAAALERCGAKARVVDALDRAQLRDAIEASNPETMVHLLTSIPERLHPRKLRTQLAATNRLRTEGTQRLLDAMSVAGVRRLVVQSVAFAYTPEGAGPCSEDDPLHIGAPPAYAGVVDAIRTLEALSLNQQDVEGIVLRYGFFYGPGTAYAGDGSFAIDVRKRAMPVLGKGKGVFSFIHVEDAASATLKAIETGTPGVYNIVDDDAAPVADWLPHYARLLEAPAPMKVPRLLGRLVGGPYATYLMCDQRGASNEKAKRELGWSPRFASWRDGFQHELGLPLRHQVDH